MSSTSLTHYIHAYLMERAAAKSYEEITKGRAGNLFLPWKEPPFGIIFTYYIRERADGARARARPFSACSLCRNGWMGAGGWARGTLDLTPNLPVCLCPDCILIAACFLLCLQLRESQRDRRWNSQRVKMCMPNARNKHFARNIPRISGVWRLLLISLVVLLLDRVLYDGLDPRCVDFRIFFLNILAKNTIWPVW